MTLLQASRNAATSLLDHRHQQATVMPQSIPKIRPARGLIAWFFARTRFAGLCLPPIGIWLAPELLTRQRAGMPRPAPGTDAAHLLRHELRHWHQAQALGVARWYGLYAWWTLTRGYRNNPLEIDARAIADGYLDPYTPTPPVPGARTP